MSSTNGGPSVTTTPNVVVQAVPAGSSSVPFDPSSVAITGGTIGGVTTIRGMPVATRRAFKAVTPARSSFRSVMASPPTTTFTGSGTIASSIQWPSVTTNGADYRVSLSPFSIARAANAVINGLAFPNYNYVAFQNVNYGGGTLASNNHLVSFMHDGSALEIAVKGQTGGFLVKVDDQYISLTPQTVPNDGGTYRYYIPFGSTKKRRIDYIGSGNVPFGGVFTAATDSIEPAPLRGPRVVVVGDSFTEGTGSNNSDNWVNAFADAMGWDDVWSSGVGSTGYLAVTGQKLKYRDRFAGDVAAFSPDIILFTGGLNDNGNSTGAQIGAEAQLLFAQAASSCPNALLVAVGPFWKGGASSVPVALISIRDNIKAAVLAAGGLFIDPLEMPLSPVGYVPQVTSLNTGVSAGVTSLVLAAQPAQRATYKFSDGSRFQVKTVTGSAGAFTVTTDGPIQTAQLAGAVVTQVGDCFWTGTGKAGATTGYGNSDLYIISDGTHPSPAGHTALGQAVASLLTAALA